MKKYYLIFLIILVNSTVYAQNSRSYSAIQGPVDIVAASIDMDSGYGLMVAFEEIMLEGKFISGSNGEADYMGFRGKLGYQTPGLGFKPFMINPYVKVGYGSVENYYSSGDSRNEKFKGILYEIGASLNMDIGPGFSIGVGQVFDEGTGQDYLNITVGTAIIWGWKLK